MKQHAIKKTYGDFTVINSSVVYNNKRHCGMVKCKCKCGKEVYVNVYTLQSGKSLRCRKCYGKKIVGKNNPNYTGFGDIPGSLLYRIKKQAKQRGLTFSVTDKYLQELYLSQNKKCAITGLDILFENRTASLDRIRSSEGYEPYNVWWVHKDVNVMKNGYELEYFSFICEKVHEKHLLTNSTTNFKYGK